MTEVTEKNRKISYLDESNQDALDLKTFDWRCEECDEEGCAEDDIVWKYCPYCARPLKITLL